MSKAWQVAWIWRNVAKHLRHWIAHFIFKINNYERMTSITKYRVDSMYSKSVFIYFSIILYIVEISQSTSAPSVDSHRSNRDSGAHRDNSSFIMLIKLLQKFIYKWFPFHLDLCNYSYLDNTNACYMRYADICIVYLDTCVASFFDNSFLQKQNTHVLNHTVINQTSFQGIASVINNSSANISSDISSFQG